MSEIILGGNWYVICVDRIGAVFCIFIAYRITWGSFNRADTEAAPDQLHENLWRWDPGICILKVSGGVCVQPGLRRLLEALRGKRAGPR